ncbi:O-antigen ligase family protein [Phyllobacterium sp. 0TCS1.6C]|uniref:O-antigen ligase family protein n=1 Tax=unclassified Phyllobacterium TaxID=2638441 RepID=UPI002264EB55|nr:MULTISPECIES: O-antigen ligase family protein [unclassified Phyllobacterium]MCX8279963.1 O-antigen ligase family protein [Phyllobacterium sp. 0TCS1.6C]MCX8296130.1 O-antigen ligase family protein [Phyllobacterium sp. 0TCS1.6A]
MATNVFGVCVLLFGILVQFMHRKYALYGMLALTLFGAAAALTLPALGGASILVANAFLVFFAWRTLRITGLSPFLSSLLAPSSGFWLLLLITYGIISTIFFPRLFAGVTETMMVQRLPGGLSRIVLNPLTFSSTHLTQTVYALGGVVCFAASFAYFRLKQAFHHFLGAFFFLCGLNVLFAILDLATFATGTGELLEFIHTANYSLMTAVEMGGLKRISGTFPESSSFATFTLILFAISASLYLDNVRPLRSGFYALASLVLLLLSTSGTAYVGLMATMALLMVQSFAPVFNGGRMRKQLFIYMGGMCAIALLLLIAVLSPTIIDAVAAFFDESLFGKLDSASGRERGYWNEVAWTNFVESFGLGVGVGGARASSYVFVLLSNVGVPGALCFVFFVASTLFRRSLRPSGGQIRHIVRAIRCGIAANLVGAALVGTVFDLGMLFYVLAGAAAAAAYPAAKAIAPARKIALPGKELTGHSAR